MSKHGAPEIFNTEHGRAIGSSGHATSGQPVQLHRVYQGAGRSGNQDQHGRQRCLARQRLRRTLGRAIKYEEVYLRAYASVSKARASIGRYIVFCSTVRRRTRTNGVCLAHPAFQSSGKPLASHLIPRIKCFCAHPDRFLIRLMLDGKTPDQAYFNLLLPVPVAA